MKDRVCLEYLRLLAALTDAHTYLCSVNAEQIQAIKTCDDPQFDRLLPRIRVARLKADLALEELVAHMQLHKCRQLEMAKASF